MLISTGSYVSSMSLEKTMLGLLKFIYTTHLFKSHLKKLENPTCSKRIHTNSWYFITRCRFINSLRSFLKTIFSTLTILIALNLSPQMIHSLTLVNLFTLEISSTGLWSGLFFTPASPLAIIALAL